MDWFDDFMDNAFGIERPVSRLEGFQFPDFYEDPDYRATQDYMRELGFNFLEGNIPDYYAPIGEMGGPQFENYMGLVTGDVTRAAHETAAATGRRGGAVSELVTNAVGPLSTRSRFADYMRMLSGRSSLLNFGRGVTEGVRNAGQNQGQYRNAFNLNQTGQRMNLGQYMDQYDVFADTALGEAQSTFINNLFSGGVVGSLGGNINLNDTLEAAGIDINSIFSGGGGGSIPPGTSGVTPGVSQEGLGNIDLGGLEALFAQFAAAGAA